MEEGEGLFSKMVTKLTGGYQCGQNHAHNNKEDANICNKNAERERQDKEKEINEKAKLQKENQKLREKLHFEKQDHLRERQDKEKEIAEKAELQKENQNLKDELRTTSQCCVVS